MTGRYVRLASDQAAIIQERVSPMDKIDIKPMKASKTGKTSRSIMQRRARGEEGE